ncbi:MAG: branched-chain amino acid ABC transporter substrate-binding protein [Desulfobacteraceae bacterium]|nr:MAG: branched-chain amino acid ABC transporter substrate-binding protein [Desulfobacteraceae bacterium]
MKSSSKRIVVATGFALCLIGVFLFSGPALAQIKIGYHAPLTGPAAADGKSCKIAAEMAVEKLNKEGGVLGQKVELVIYDDQAKAEQAVPIANKLVGQDKVKFAVSGSYSLPTRAAATIFQQAKVPYITAYAVHPDITKAGNYMFRVEHLGPPQGRAGAKFIASNLGLKRVSAIIMDNDYGVSTAEGFKSAADKLGLKIVNSYTYSLKDRQFGSIVASVKADNPDAVYITAYFFTAGPLVSQLRSAGVKVPIIGSQAFDAQQFLDIAKETAEGVYNVGGFYRDRKDPELEVYIKEFEKRAGYPADNVSATSYSAIMLMADAIKRAKSTDPEKVRDTLSATRNYPLLTGLMASFNKMGEFNKPMNINVVKNGKFQHYATIDDLDLLKAPEE